MSITYNINKIFNGLNSFFIGLILIIFMGSIFITSNKFVDSEIAPKFYFTVIGVFIFIFITLFLKKTTYKNLSFYNNITLFSGIFIILVTQAIFGLLQYVSVFRSNHSAFRITGSFENPTGLAAVLSISFSIGLFLLSKTKKAKKKWIVLGMILCSIAVFISGSRTGILTIIISFISFILLSNSVKLHFKSKIIFFSIIISLLIALFLLFVLKQNSTISRLYIWEISFELIKDKPIFGHGYQMFEALYMDEQANYFTLNPNSKYKDLADNVKHPLNEFLKIIIEFGFVGFIILITSLSYFLNKILKSKSEFKIMALSGIVAFLTFSFFSYPLQYPPIWLILILFFLIPLAKNFIFINKMFTFFKLLIGFSIIFSMVYISHKMKAEIKWKKTAINSLIGDTVKMLPNYTLLKQSLNKNPYFLYNYGAELNRVEEYNESISILLKCKEKFNDYDLQILLANNYYALGEINKAIKLYKYASNMIPSRFLPFYKLFEIYKKNDQKKEALKYANVLLNKKVKIPSFIISSMKLRAKNYINE